MNRQWGEKADGEQETASRLGQPRKQSVRPARPQPQALEHRSRSCGTASAEPPEELLATVRGERKAHGQPNDEESQVHGRTSVLNGYTRSLPVKRAGTDQAGFCSVGNRCCRISRMFRSGAKAPTVDLRHLLSLL